MFNGESNETVSNTPSAGSLQRPERAPMYGQEKENPDVLPARPPPVKASVEANALQVENPADEEFYHRLLEMKEHHKRTLEVCEKLYNEKLASRDFTSTSYGEQLRNLIGESDQRKEADNILLSSTTSSKKTQKKEQRNQSSAGPQGPYFQTSTIINNWAVVPSMEEYVVSTEGGVPRESRESAVNRISEMWRDFSVKQARRSKAAALSNTRPRSASMSRLSKPKQQKEAENKTQQAWKHRVTIPEPFKMTIREDSKPLRKSQIAEEMTRVRLQKEKQDLAECAKQFRARPVPAHVYMPLYDDIMESQEARRKYNVEHCKVMLQSAEKPFQFQLRDEAKKKENQAQNRKGLSRLDDGKKSTFKANPYPKHLFDDDPQKQREVDEELRKLRLQMRADELLKEAKLPPSMEERGLHYKKQRPMSAVHPSAHLHVPKVNAYVPDFEELHRQFTKEMSRRKNQQEGTVCRPFHFESNHVLTKKKQRMHTELDQQAKNTNQNLRKSKTTLTRQLSSSMDALPTRLTTATVLRNSTNKTKLEQKAEEDRAILERQRRQRMREEQLQKEIKNKALTNDNTPNLKAHRHQKLQEYKESERTRQIEYHRQLNEMKDRLQKRPFLFEKSTEENARKNADKRYHDALQRAGVPRPKSTAEY